MTKCEQKQSSRNAATTEVSSPAGEHLACEADFRDGMRALAGAVNIIACGKKGQRRGLTATAVCSVTADPPRLLVCINKSGAAHDLIESQGRLSVNTISKDQVSLAKRFAGMIPGISGEDQFTEGVWSERRGVPILDDASAVFVCEVNERIVQSTHTIFICDVLACASGAGQGAGVQEGLLYFDGDFRCLAPIVGDETVFVERL